MTMPAPTVTDHDDFERQLLELVPSAAGSMSGESTQNWQ